MYRLRDEEMDAEALIRLNQQHTKGAMRDYSSTELNTAIDEWILNEKHRAILKRRLIDGICFEPLAEEFDMSVRQIKRIVYKSQEVLFRHI